MGIQVTNETRLPRWAQERMESYRRQIRDAHAELVALKTGSCASDSSFFIEHWEREGRFYLPVPLNGRLQYEQPVSAPERWPHPPRIEITQEREYIRAVALDGAMVVKPGAANVVLIKTEGM